MEFWHRKNTITSVEQIIENYIYWGKGKFKKTNKKKFYEQTNLQLNIEKSKTKLRWKPRLSIDECISITVDWYKQVINNDKSVEIITKDQIFNYMKINDKKN